jgi:hypothetical protein
VGKDRIERDDGKPRSGIVSSSDHSGP